MMNNRLVENAGCRLQVTGQRLKFTRYRLRSGKTCQIYHETMFDECLIGFAHLQNPCLMMFNEKHLFDKSLF